MKKLTLVFISCVPFLLGGCNSSDDLATRECFLDVRYNGSSISYCPDDRSDQSVVLDREQDEFIWQAMNLFYYWQNDISVLADDAFASYDDLHTFLNGFSSSEQLFANLLSSQDRFSWIVDDYVALEESFQGISTSFGYRIAVVLEDDFVDNPQPTDRLLGFVQFVEPGGPADLAGLERGSLFNEVDGTQLTISNVNDLLSGRQSYQLNAVDLVDGQLQQLEQSYSLSRAVVSANPIYLSKVIDLGGTKVGYLSYNQFVYNNNTHRALNSVFGDFKSEGINELVLDLRYNPGGSVTTTRILSSMIVGAATQSDNLGSIVYNEKLGQYFDTPLRFFEQLPIFEVEETEDGRVNTTGSIESFETMNRLDNLTRVFILTGTGTASASELVTVGVDPYLPVIQIGDTTVGKNEGSVTLYDSKTSLFLDGEDADINPNHTYAIQPIISKLANSVGLTDYEDGLVPDLVVKEAAFLENLPPLGDPTEPLLAEALGIISGLARKAPANNSLHMQEILDMKDARLQTTRIEPHYIPKSSLELK